MRVYKVSPIVKYSPFFTLTYVSKESFEPGNIVPINFNNREIYAVVLESFSLKDAKVEIRKADFQTKKIEKRTEEKVEKFLDKKLFEVLKIFSKTNMISVGELVFFIFGDSLTPNPSPKERGAMIIYYPDDLSFKVNKKIKVEEDQDVKLKGAEIFREVLENSFETITIKDFNFDKYLNFQAPHISKLDLLFEIIGLTPDPSPKERGARKKIILETDFLGVVEKNFLSENIVDGKLFGKYKIEIKEKRNIAKKFLVKVGRDKNGEEEILPREVVEKIDEEEKTFLFVLSHGFADRIFCNDCRKSYDCENCGNPFSILNEEEGRFMYCKSCKNKKVLQEDQYLICKHCGSWRIFPFGIGGQKVQEFLISSCSSLRCESTSLKGDESALEKESIVLIDESQKKMSVKKILGEVEDFLENKEQHILIGSIRTLKVLQNLNPKINKSFIVSTGPLVRGKHFDSDEKLLKLISEIENISKEVYINKRESDEVSLENYKDKEKFIEQEIVFRKKSGLPPMTKVLSLVFNYRNKRFVDKFILQNIEEFKNAGEIKKGNNFVYFWFVKPDSEILKTVEILRQFGDVILANSIIEQSILGKK